jgi:CheY-like chemotaxis protein
MNELGTSMTSPPKHDPSVTPVDPDTVLRVVIVDDNAAFRALVRALLERSGRATIVADADGSPEEVAIACRQAPDVVLLDQNLRGVLGTELIGQIRRACPETMVAVYSALDRVLEEPAARRAGAFTYYEKSVVTPALVDHLVADHARFRRTLAGEEDRTRSIDEHGEWRARGSQV